MPTMQEVRAKYPQYQDMSDAALADALHRKFYADMPREEFNAKIGLGSNVPSPSVAAPQGAPPAGAEPSRLGAAVLGALDTATFGFLDEGAAGLGYLLDKLPGNQGRPYDEILATARGSQNTAQEAFPGTYLAGQVAGGVGAGVGAGAAGLLRGVNAARSGAGLARVAGNSAIDGLAMGAAQGAGTGEDAEGRISGAVSGAAIGGLGGAVAPYATAAGGAVVRAAAAPVLARLNPAGYAQAAIGETVRRSGLTAEDIAARLGQAADDGQGMFTVADAMGHEGGRRLAGLARTPNDARRELVDALNGRQSGQGERLSSFVADGFGAPDTAAQRAARLTAERRTAADANYGGARASAGSVDASGAIAAADDFLQPGASGVLSPQSGIADDSIEGAVRRARSYLTDGRSVVSDFDAAFRSKREIDAMIERAQPAVQRQLIPIRNALDDALAQSSPQYAGARDTFRQQSRAIDAVETGRNAASGRTRAADNIPTFQGMTPDEQAAFRAGYADPIQGRIEAASSSPSTNKARMLQTEKTRQEFPAFAAPGRADELQRRLMREQTMFETHNAALGGSRTADNLADQAELAQFDPSIVTGFMERGLVGGTMNAVARALNEGRGLTPAVSERVVRAMMETDPVRARAALASSSAADQARTLRNARIIAALNSSGAVGAGRLAAP